MDEQVARSQASDRLFELLRPELARVVAHHLLERPAPGGEVGRDPARELGGPRAEGLRGVRCSSAQQYAEATSIAVYCHTAPLAAESLPMKKQSSCTISPGREACRCRWGAGGLRSGSGGAA
jgi:hypothetical protein